MLAISLYNAHAKSQKLFLVKNWSDYIALCERWHIASHIWHKQSLQDAVEKLSHQMPKYIHLIVREVSESHDPWDIAKFLRSGHIASSQEANQPETLEKSTSNSTISDRRIAEIIRRSLAKELQSVTPPVKPADLPMLPGRHPDAIAGTVTWNDFLRTQKKDPSHVSCAAASYAIHRIINRHAYLRNHEAADREWHECNSAHNEIEPSHRDYYLHAIKSAVMHNPHLITDALAEQRKQHEFIKQHFPHAIQMSNGQECIGLSRGLRSDQHSKNDRTLASYADMSTSAFGNCTHGYFVPLNHIWHMYHLSPGACAGVPFGSEREVLVDNKHPRIQAPSQRIENVIPDLHRHPVISSDDVHPGYHVYSGDDPERKHELANVKLYQAQRTHGDISHLPIDHAVSEYIKGGILSSHRALSGILRHPNLTENHIAALSEAAVFPEHMTGSRISDLMSASLPHEAKVHAINSAVRRGASRTGFGPISGLLKNPQTVKLIRLQDLLHGLSRGPKDQLYSSSILNDAADHFPNADDVLREFGTSKAALSAGRNVKLKGK
jgi:hypothetical protein